MLDYLWRQVDEFGRDRSELDISFGTPAGGSPGDDDFGVDEHLTGLAELATLGVNWSSVNVPGDSLDHAIETLERYGERVIRAQ